ncbi:MAG: hypothetical protein MUP82_10990 [Candidatus Marinimicrobia bacterium]|nr:hypothetical protein [Candidatus Neomarinimicrobiota bacterium]
MSSKKMCKGLTFEDCELAILRMAVDKAEEKMAKRVVNSDEIKQIIKIVEDFIKRKNLICYGGTAINNILPSDDQFYNKDIEIPDYDFFTINALADAKELADLYYSKGFTDVEAKAGQHHGTYKVFVNYIPVADLTLLPKGIYNSLKKDAIRVGGILYTPPNYLRMSMYLELSRPAGDTSRWEKVMKRLSLLNKHYPVTDLNCNEVDFQREMANKTQEDVIYDVVRNTLVNQGVVFFGGYALSLYSQYMPGNIKKKVEKVADFDVLSNDPETTAEIVKERLKDSGIKNAKIRKRDPVGEVIPVHYEVCVGSDTIVMIYKPIACHSYNNITIAKQKVKIATIDTMLSFYLAFLYADRPYYNHFLDRILCMSSFLFDVQQKNRLEQKGLLTRFSITCYGHQESVEEMRASKAEKYKELKQSKDKNVYEEWFLNYKPDDLKQQKSDDSQGKKNKNKNKNKKNKRKTQKKKPFAIYGGKTRRTR